MTAAIAASAVRTCLGDGAESFEALLRGATGVGALRGLEGDDLNVAHAYHVEDPPPEHGRFRASAWLAECVRDALADAGVRAGEGRVVVLVGTGLRELGEVERWARDGAELEAERLHFAHAVRAANPQVGDVVTICNACSASGHALALAQDLVELGEADVVVAAGADSMTASMLAIIGRVAEEPADQLRPFDERRGGALLGEGAAAVVVVPDGAHDRPRARLLATGLSCDAHHETAATLEGLERALQDALARSGRAPGDVDLVIAHATGTAVNDPLESQLLRRTFGRGSRAPLVTGVKGALGHMSGTAALIGVDVAIRCLREGAVPPVAGLQARIPEALGLSLVADHWAVAPMQVAQVNAFGFGGVNAVTLLEAAR